MKKSVLSFIIYCIAITSLKALDANISFAVFKSDEGPYVEIYLHLVGQTVEFVSNSDSTMQSNMEVVILFKNGDEIVKFDKYQLNSPEYATPQDFFDTKRYAVGKGTYKLDVSIHDLNKTENSKRYTKDLEVKFSENRVHLSDIQLVASLRKIHENETGNPMAKGGYVFEPLPSQFYDRFCERLMFYTEIYDTDKYIGDDFLVSYYMEATAGERKSKAVGVVHKRRSPNPVVPFLQQIDIAELPSGNYNLVVELKNKAGELMSKKSIAFQRSNPYLNSTREEIAKESTGLENEFVSKMTVEELRYALRAIAMQVDDIDGELLNTIILEEKPEAMRLYLFSFWAKEDAANPERAFKNYMVIAKAIDQKFRNGFGPGFESDRGYIYMKYGVPSDIVSMETEQSAPPYEIWFYNQFPQTGQNNVKFLFYNPSLATNGHVLLHSTARGEISNPMWEVELYKDAPNEVQGNNTFESTQMQGNMGRHARRLFESF